MYLIYIKICIQKTNTNCHYLSNIFSRKINFKHNFYHYIIFNLQDEERYSPCKRLFKLRDAINQVEDLMSLNFDHVMGNLFADTYIYIYIHFFV